MTAFACDKCGRDVPASNDASMLDAIRTGDPFAVPSTSRHLFPVDDPVTGEQLCEGSPSRVQYLEGQPRDQREGRTTSYFPKKEGQIRSAYAELRARYCFR